MTRHTMLTHDEARSREGRYLLYVLTSWALFVGLCFGVIYTFGEAITFGKGILVGLGLYGMFRAISVFLKRRDPLIRILSDNELHTLKLYYDLTPEVRRWFQEGYGRGCVPRLRDLREAERAQPRRTAVEQYRLDVDFIFNSDDR